MLGGQTDINLESRVVNVIEGKGEFLGGEATGLVERLDSEDVVKSPWMGRPTASACKQEMAIEAKKYERFEAHPRFVQFKHRDPVGHVLTLEYMPNGDLKDYVRKHQQEISMSQRQNWVLEVIEGAKLLHSHNVIQDDVGPHDSLLDVDLSLKICDFDGSSSDGLQATVAPGVRYRLPSLGATTVQEDLFALGSTIYFPATEHEPYEDLTDEDQVEKPYEDGVFPSLSKVPFAKFIALCCRQEAESITMITELVGSSSS